VTHVEILTAGASINNTWKLPVSARSSFSAAYSGECQKRSAASRSGHSEISALAGPLQPPSHR